MRLLLLMLLLVVGCSAPPEPPPAPPEKVRPDDVWGFETTRLGMQPAEVKAGLGWPVAPCGDNDEEWCLDSFNVDGQACKVRFYFEKDGLSRVVVRGGQGAFRALLGVYGSRWGPPDESSDARAVWTFPSCRIELTGGPRTEMVFGRPSGKSG